MATTSNQFIKRTILVVDDCTDMLNLGKSILEFDGFNVWVADSGNQALEILSNIEELDLILLDMNLPDMNGHTFLSILNKRNSKIVQDVPIVFYTGVDEPNLTYATGFIRKNGDIEKFLSEVHRFINEKKQVA